MVVLGYLPKLERGLGLAFGEHLLLVFFHENVPGLIPYHLTMFQCHTFYPDDI